MAEQQRKLRKMPNWASAMVGNWRRIANLPDTVTDDAIFTIVDTERLSWGSGYTDEENEESVSYLRQELGL
jgi:hypothetical protein